jgi:hypothetical protein
MAGPPSTPTAAEYNAFAKRVLERFERGSGTIDTPSIAGPPGLSSGPTVRAGPKIEYPAGFFNGDAEGIVDPTPSSAAGSPLSPPGSGGIKKKKYKPSSGVVATAKAEADIVKSGLAEAANEQAVGLLKPNKKRGGYKPAPSTMAPGGGGGGRSAILESLPVAARRRISKVLKKAPAAARGRIKIKKGKPKPRKKVTKKATKKKATKKAKKIAPKKAKKGVKRRRSASAKPAKRAKKGGSVAVFL